MQICIRNIGIVFAYWHYIHMLKQQIQADTKEAMKQGNHEMVGVLRMTLAAITSKEKEKRYKISKEHPDLEEEKLIKESELTDEQVVDVLSSEVKKRRDAIALYEKGNRPELAENEKKEIAVLQKYLPEQLSAEEIKNLIEESINKVGAKEMKDIGKVMADLTPKIKGKADNGQVSKIIKEILSQN